MSNIANRLKGLRKAKGVRQKDVTSAIGINERTYRSYEAGAIEPSAVTIVKLADYFNISADYLLCRTDNPNMYL